MTFTWTEEPKLVWRLVADGTRTDITVRAIARGPFGPLRVLPFWREYQMGPEQVWWSVMSLRHEVEKTIEARGLTAFCAEMAAAVVPAMT